MRLAPSARLLAGAFLLLGEPLGAERLRVAAEQAGRPCGESGPPLGIARARPGGEVPEELANCVVIFPVKGFSDPAVLEASGALSRLGGVFGAMLELSAALEMPAEERPLRVPFALKQFSSAIRSASPDAKVLVSLSAIREVPETEIRSFAELLSSEELHPYIDGVAFLAGEESMGIWVPEKLREAWVFTRVSEEGRAVGELLGALQRVPSATLLGALAEEPQELPERGWPSLRRLQAYWTEDVSQDPTPTKVTRPDGTPVDVLRFFDAKRFTPILLLWDRSAGRVAIELPAGAYSRASVENLATGARRDFDLPGGARALTLDLSAGPLAVRIQPAARTGRETRAAVEVGAVRGLTAEEIVARERAWDAGQRERLTTFVAEMEASLRLRVGEFNETFNLTIRGPFFFRRGEPADWAWKEFYLNGVKWKGKTLPKIPILQPEKVTTLPLDIRLSEDYQYELAGESSVGRRRAFQIRYAPKSHVGEKPIYRGTVWIDAETFALLRRESIQLNLKGETLSNIQNEFFSPVPGTSQLFLPLEIRGQQVFSTAGRTTAIERYVVMSRVEVNPPDFAGRLQEAHASPTQMIRDTEKGMRYLIPDPQSRQNRIVEQEISKKNTFGLVGAFYDDALESPLPLLGVQHFNFDLWGKQKQLSVFFGGALLTGNYTDPSLGGSRFDLGADLFAVALPFGDASYRGGKEIPEEKIKRLPAFFQINIGAPLGPYLKTSLQILTRWDNFQRDEATGPRFVTPVDTTTSGAELRLITNVSGYNATASASYHRRNKWRLWGDPSTSEYDPVQRDFIKYSVSFSKNLYFRGFRKLHVGLSYLGGSDLDRFSKYDFGPFSGNPLRGFKTGSVKTESAVLASISYGLNIREMIRFEAFYDQAIVRDKESGFDNTYFSGAGLTGSLNGPWSNSLLRFEAGVPVVGHGIKGFVANLVLLKLF